MTEVTLGIVPYLNALPLVEGLQGMSTVRLIRAVPSRLTDLLSRGEVDAATLPIADAASDPTYRVIPGISIGSRGEVGSVKLFHREELEAVRTVRLDPASRTSVILLKILLEKRFGLRPAYRTGPAGEGSDDAYLLIGDDCLFADPGGYRALDLGAAWTSWTGLPFVYAAWVARKELPGLSRVLSEARRRGLAVLDRIVLDAAESLGRDAERIDSYLRRMMRYDLDGDALEAVDLFYHHAADLGALPEGAAIRLAEADSPRGH
ncbi:MAG: menaquinone biosynthesis protein [Planctomycetota bacterium]|nr:menaquinone biosynthesis protein [Planctomycetota bacterium]